MTLHETLSQKLADWRPTGPGRHSLSCAPEGAGWSVSLTADRADSLSCLVWELALRRAGGEAPPLAERAAAVAARVTGLLEPLAVHEVDAERGEALLRSREPAQRGGWRAYFEARLTGPGQVTLRRYRAPLEPGGRREQIAFALTHEALAKVAEDLAV